MKQSTMTLALLKTTCEDLKLEKDNVRFLHEHDHNVQEDLENVGRCP